MLIQSTTRAHRPYSITLLSLITLMLRYTLLTLGVLVMMLPFLWALSVGVSKDPSAVVHLADAAFNVADGDLSPLWSALWPQEFTTSWFERAFNDFPLLNYLNNSAILSSVTVTLTLALSIPAAFAFAQMEFYGRNVMFIILLATIMIPSEVSIVPNYLTLGGMKLLNTYAAAVLPNIASALGVFLLKQYFEQLPKEIFDAARVDGAKEWQLLWHIAIPQSYPAITALAIMTMVLAWNDYLWPALVLKEAAKQPVTVSVFNMLTGPLSSISNLVLATTVLAIVPVLLCLSLGQRFFLGGMQTDPS
ncbi:carbohydrate ABC transporter permease [Deefgea rivuli]|uniref:carbohydrate ABC transporter permease n=1 Tax=Deefgea rivuli TaxID=400948 RepID=UPI0006878683|nr:carbohydrate ABC transporter permease [Deefgea rivuli]